MAVKSLPATLAPVQTYCVVPLITGELMLAFTRESRSRLPVPGTGLPWADCTVSVSASGALASASISPCPAGVPQPVQRS